MRNLVNTTYIEFSYRLILVIFLRSFPRKNAIKLSLRNEWVHPGQCTQLSAFTRLKKAGVRITLWIVFLWWSFSGISNICGLLV